MSVLFYIELDTPFLLPLFVVRVHRTRSVIQTKPVKQVFPFERNLSTIYWVEASMERRRNYLSPSSARETTDPIHAYALRPIETIHTLYYNRTKKSVHTTLILF